MPNREIAAAYDLIAERWADDSFNKEDGLALHKRALSFLEKPTVGTALNVGCGCNTRFNALIKAQGLQLEGIDISPRMVEFARTGNPSTPVHLQDVCTWKPQRKYKLITAWDSIWHVQLKEQHALMLKLMTALEPAGVILFTAGGLDGPDEHSNSSMGPLVYYSTLGIPRLLDVIKQSNCIVRHLEFDQLPEKHLCIVAQKAINEQ